MYLYSYLFTALVFGIQQKKLAVCPVVLSHAPGPMSARVNGVYVPTGDRSFGQPVFHNPHTDMWLEYFDCRWVVREGGGLTGPHRYIASITPEHACLPHECAVGGVGHARQRRQDRNRRASTDRPAVHTSGHHLC